MEIYAFMYYGMKCPKCGSELDTGFNCPKCKAKIYKETVSEYNTNGEKIYEKNTVKLVQPDPTWITSIDYAIESPKHLDNGELELGKNEEIIDTFAYGVHQVLQDNGKSLFDIKEEK